MFGFSKSKTGAPKTKDIIWMTESAKWNGIMDEWKKDPSLVMICWFNTTCQHLQTMFARETNSEVPAFLANQVHVSRLSGKKIVFAEHHPLLKKEQELFEKLSLPEIIIHSALDEPMFAHFGGDKIVKMMKQLGMKEDQPVQHKMISQAIVNAQEKIEKKVGSEQLAHSQQEWMNLNLGV